MAEEIKKEEKVSRMSDETVDTLMMLKSSLAEAYKMVSDVLKKRSCNRAEASLIKALAVILKAKLTALHKTKITNI